jgi:hypothetical protein
LLIIDCFILWKLVDWFIDSVGKLEVKFLLAYIGFWNGWLVR